MAGKDINTKAEVLEEDEIIYEEELSGKKPEASFNLEDFFARNKNMILGGVAVVLLGAAGIWWYNNSLVSKNKEAEEALISAVNYFEKDSFNLAIAGDGVNPGLEGIVEEYGATKTGNIARFYLGAAYLQTGKAAEAVEVLEKFKTGDNVASGVALGTLATAYEETGDFDKAAKIYEEAAETPGANHQTTPYYLLQAARAWEEAGKNDKALELYREVKKKYPLSPEGQAVDMHIAKLSPEDDNF